MIAVHRGQPRTQKVFHLLLPYTVHFIELQIYMRDAPHEMHMCRMLGTHIIGNIWEGFLKSAHQYCMEDCDIWLNETTLT